MKHNDIWKLAFRCIARSRAHTLLCVLAICIGIASVTLILGLGNAASSAVQQEIDQIGLQGVALYHKKGEELSAEVMEAVANIDGVASVIPFSITTGSIQLRNFRSNAAFAGIAEPVNDSMNLQVLYGSLPTAEQLRSGEKIAVIDADFAQKAYRRQNVVGKTLQISVNGVREELEICGVIQSQAEGVSMFGLQVPHLVYLPNKVLQSIAPTAQTSNLLIGGEAGELPEITKRVHSYINRVFGDLFKLENISQYLDRFLAVTSAITHMIGAVAGISILVGGVGVMNSMIAAVERRTREIGIYRALGANKRMIVGLFLCEAVLLCVIGGILGLLMSFIGLQLLHITLSLHMAALSIMIAVGCGILFGTLPAIKAMRMDPIQAIRSE